MNDKETLILNPQLVEAIFKDCLSKKDEDARGHVKVDGIISNVTFHPDRLESHKEEIRLMLNELPDDFRVSKGGGMSFLKACYDRHGNLWTGLQAVMAMLFQLGTALGIAKSLFPREMWVALPGGMPYYAVEG